MFVLGSKIENLLSPLTLSLFSFSLIPLLHPLAPKSHIYSIQGAQHLKPFILGAPTTGGPNSGYRIHLIPGKKQHNIH
jgi:hypothetical protein